MTLGEAIENSFIDDPPETLIDPDDANLSWRAGFDVARRVRGILAINGYDRPTTPENFREIVENAGDANGWDSEVLFDEFALAWDKVRLPEGEDRLTMAWQMATETPEKLPSNFPSNDIRALCETLAACARILAAGNCGVAFFPTRKIGDLIGKHHAFVARAIRLLTDRGILRLTRAHTMNQAAEFAYIPVAERASVAKTVAAGISLDVPATLSMRHSISGLTVFQVDHDKQVLQNNRSLHSAEDGVPQATALEPFSKTPKQEPDPEASQNKRPDRNKRERSPAEQAVSVFDRQWRELWEQAKSLPPDQAAEIMRPVFAGDPAEWMHSWQEYDPAVLREATRNWTWDRASGRDVPLMAFCVDHERAGRHAKV